MPSLRDLERSPKFQRATIVGLRIALGIIFLWFGALKVLGYNPVYEIVYASPLPFLASHIGNLLLGFFEMTIGICLLLNAFRRLTHITLFGHMMGTLSVFFTAPELMFSPAFPVLTLAGEFVFKNIVLVTSGLVVLFHDHRP